MAYNFEGITILVVEESEAIRSLIKDVLSVFGVGNILLGTNGQDGLKLACDYNPDIIITEIVLPKLDGPEMIKKIRTSHKSINTYVPIIVLTAFSELKRIKLARDSGVNEIMVKPFTARDLYNRIAYVIENPRQFVIAESFKGPDRRRKPQSDFYNGPKRREKDPEDYEFYPEEPVIEVKKYSNTKKKKAFSIYTGAKGKTTFPKYQEEDYDFDLQ